MTDFYKPIKYTSINKADNRDGPTEQAIRLYSVQYGTSWNLQVRGPLCLANHSPSKQGVIASAYLDLDSMRELRDTINGFLSEIEQQEAA